MFVYVYDVEVMVVGCFYYLLVFDEVDVMGVEFFQVVGFGIDVVVFDVQMYL